MHATKGLALAGLTASGLLLVGCTGSKLSAAGAAQKLQDYLSTGYSVQCVPLSKPYWDYMCKVRPPHGAKETPYRLQVKVGPKEIVDRVYCGKQGSLPSSLTEAGSKC